MHAIYTWLIEQQWNESECKDILQNTEAVCAVEIGFFFEHFASE